jgi:sporulation protein YlmC with PRC-barrel domain
MIRLHQFDNARVRTESGESLGHVHEVHVKDGQVTALVCGPGGLIQRMASSRSGKRVKWADVTAVTKDGIVVRDRK